MQCMIQLNSAISGTGTSSVLSAELGIPKCSNESRDDFSSGVLMSFDHEQKMKLYSSAVICLGVKLS